MGRTWAFALNEVGATESLSRKGICPDSGAHRLPLAAVGGTGCGRGGQGQGGGAALVQVSNDGGWLRRKSGQIGDIFSRHISVFAAGSILGGKEREMPRFLASAPGGTRLPFTERRQFWVEIQSSV